MDESEDEDGDGHLYPEGWTERLFRDHERRHAYDGETGDAFRAWQSEFRADLRSVLGLPTIEAAGVPPLSPERVERVDGESHADGGTHRREEWRLRTESNFRLPVSVLLPHDSDPPYPVAITLHGHGEGGRAVATGRPGTAEQRRQVREEERDMAVQAVERGYAAIAPTTRGLGDLANREDEELGYRTCHTLQLHAQLFGRSLAGDRVWDVTRLLDFVESRDRFDEDRVVLTGHSGGGATALFAAAVDERVDAAAVSSYFCSFEASIASIDHCECNYVPGLVGLGEQWDIAGLVAPRPFVAVNGVDDHIFPIEGARRAFDRLESIYGAADASDRCALYEGQGGHRYYVEGVWPFVEGVGRDAG
ncbi:alpha/beta hydrolase family protein [Halosimplex halophilum]|uniref:alpha/beta hydrolase family protein n=1 Tax=Halosimplex halophilum TaxID=2559572 RepID=UPI00107FC397|nr:alpha/beta hydrolase family protein [Halosimplex halophilum]